MFLKVKIFSLIPWKKKIKFFFFKSFLKIFFCDFFMFLGKIKLFWKFFLVKNNKKITFNVLKSSLRFKLHKHQLVIKKTFFLLKGWSLLKNPKIFKKKFFLSYFFERVCKSFNFLWGTVVSWNIQTFNILILKCIVS